MTFIVVPILRDCGKWLKEQKKPLLSEGDTGKTGLKWSAHPRAYEHDLPERRGYHENGRKRPMWRCVERGDVVMVDLIMADLTMEGLTMEGLRMEGLRMEGLRMEGLRMEGLSMADRLQTQGR